MPTAKNRGASMADAFGGSQDNDHLADAQDALMSESATQAQQRARERLLRQAEQMGLQLADEGLQAQLVQLQSELETVRQQLSSGEVTTSLVPSIGVRITPVGLEFSREVSQDQWLELVTNVGTIKQAFQWMIGDLAVYATTRKWGEKEQIYQELAKMLDVNPRHLQNWASVCRRVQISERSEICSFANHEVVASLAPDWQVFFLQVAAQHKLSVRQFSSLVSMFDASRMTIEEAIQKVLLVPSRKPNIFDTYRQRQVQARADVIARFAKSSKPAERKQWLDFASEQVKQWQDILEELKGKK